MSTPAALCMNVTVFTLHSVTLFRYCLCLLSETSLNEIKRTPPPPRLVTIHSPQKARLLYPKLFQWNGASGHPLMDCLLCCYTPPPGLPTLVGAHLPYETLCHYPTHSTPLPEASHQQRLRWTRTFMPSRWIYMGTVRLTILGTVGIRAQAGSPLFRRFAEPISYWEHIVTFFGHKSSSQSVLDCLTCGVFQALTCRHFDCLFVFCLSVTNRFTVCCNKKHVSYEKFM